MVRMLTWAGFHIIIIAILAPGNFLQSKALLDIVFFCRVRVYFKHIDSQSVRSRLIVAVKECLSFRFTEHGSHDVVEESRQYCLRHKLLELLFTKKMYFGNFTIMRFDLKRGMDVPSLICHN
ncbi:hypothetical protein D3C77_418560 [compost metagenome]